MYQNARQRGRWDVAVWWDEQAKTAIETIARAVEFAAALIIAVAAIEATVKAALIFARRNTPATAKNEVRLTLGRWLAVALEFELAADILNTAVTPSWSDIEKLAAIAALRTALNYFLEREIRAETTPAQRAADEELKRSSAG
ncbi:MAG TPA: DUF1622 domain-containing protein [Bryobacteraceae bacterium]|nr:DUF1622 domain-containing protein [Bryobacteraceae bacterium]